MFGRESLRSEHVVEDRMLALRVAHGWVVMKCTMWTRSIDQVAQVERQIDCEGERRLHTDGLLE